MPDRIAEVMLEVAADFRKKVDGKPVAISTLVLRELMRPVIVEILTSGWDDQQIRDFATCGFALWQLLKSVDDPSCDLVSNIMHHDMTAQEVDENGTPID